MPSTRPYIPFLNSFEGALAVLREIEENLQQAVAIRAYQRQFLGDAPVKLYLGLVADRFEHNTQVGQDIVNIDAPGWRASGALLEFERCDLRKRFNQGAKCFKVAYFPQQHPISDRVFVNHADGSANVSNFMRNRCYQDSGAREKLLEAGLFMLSQVVRCIDDKSSQPWAGCRPVGGEENVGEENVAAFPLASAFCISVRNVWAVSSIDGTEPRDGM